MTAGRLVAADTGGTTFFQQAGNTTNGDALPDPSVVEKPLALAPQFHLQIPPPRSNKPV
jgi:hypothetical protein